MLLVSGRVVSRSVHERVEVVSAGEMMPPCH